MADLAVVRVSLPATRSTKEEAMKKLLIAAAVAAVAAVPSVTGLVGNASFAQSVPVQVPAGAKTLDDHARPAEPGDDRGQRAGPSDDRGQRTEPGDDRGGASSPGAATTRGPGDSRISGDGGSRHGGHDDGPAGR
jgi:hypothetical protein